jgi:hypothetical protein
MRREIILKRCREAYGLLLEAPAEGVSVYRFTRGAGAGREVERIVAHQQNAVVTLAVCIGYMMAHRPGF